MWISS